ncbi:MAG TPA: DUF4337 family protein [Verrucomicrobiae bacterium]|nr:DUF4337 family protein [Verrucomicrobiae bacterium]
MKPTKVTIPDELKRDVPQTLYGKVLAATPVVMAVVATMLAGLSSSEMTRAQYDRSLAAQQQSKAGDQWSFFQAKRLRGAYQQNTAELLQSLTPVGTVDVASLRVALGARANLLDSAEGRQTLALLEKGSVPPVPAAGRPNPPVQAVLDAIAGSANDTDVAAAAGKLSSKDLDDALKSARDQADAFDAATKPINDMIDQIGSALLSQAPTPGKAEAGGRSLNRDFTAARLKYTAQRYETEARLNQGIANIYEVLVRKSNFSAERHHRRSQKFFYGMLGAQLAVIISTFAIAARKRDLLWSLAAAAGILAIAFAIFVYITM